MLLNCVHTDNKPKMSPIWPRTQMHRVTAEAYYIHKMKCLQRCFAVHCANLHIIFIMASTLIFYTSLFAAAPSISVLLVWYIIGLAVTASRELLGACKKGVILWCQPFLIKLSAGVEQPLSSLVWWAPSACVLHSALQDQQEEERRCYNSSRKPSLLYSASLLRHQSKFLDQEAIGRHHKNSECLCRYRNLVLIVTEPHPSAVCCHVFIGAHAQLAPTKHFRKWARFKSYISKNSHQCCKFEINPPLLFCGMRLML